MTQVRGVRVRVVGVIIREGKAKARSCWTGQKKNPNELLTSSIFGLEDLDFFPWVRTNSRRILSGAMMCDLHFLKYDWLLCGG